MKFLYSKSSKPLIYKFLCLKQWKMHFKGWGNKTIPVFLKMWFIWYFHLETRKSIRPNPTRCRYTLSATTACSVAPWANTTQNRNCTVGNLPCSSKLYLYFPARSAKSAHLFGQHTDISICMILNTKRQWKKEKKRGGKKEKSTFLWLFKNTTTKF